MRVETRNLRHLREIHRYGATCANLNGERFVLWGGTIDSDSNDRPSDDEMDALRTDVWIYDTFVENWSKKTCKYASGSNFKLPTLTGSTSSIIGNIMLVFGGLSKEENWLNSLYALNLETFIWSDLGSNAHAKPTKPIRSDKNVSWAYADKFYVFGGYGWSQTEHMPELLDKQKDLQLCPDHRWPKFGWNNQLVEYNPSTNEWTWPSYSGRCPSARAAHSGTLIGSTYYLFGGRDVMERLNDLYTLNMKTFEWSKIATVPDTSSTVHRPLGHLFDQDDVPSEQHQQQSIQHTQQPRELQQAVSRESARTNLSLLRPRHEPSTSEDNNNDNGLAGIDYSRPSCILERWSGPLNQSTSSVDTNSCPLFEAQDGIDAASDADNEQQIINDSLEQQQQQHHDDVLAVDRQPSQPLGRSFASFTPISKESILLYGGVSSQEQSLDDCWTYSIKRNCWKQVELNCKRPRLWHAGLKSNEDEVILMAGSSGNIDTYCTDLLILSSSPNSLKKLALKTAASLPLRQITGHYFETLPNPLKEIISASQSFRS